MLLTQLRLSLNHITESLKVENLLKETTVRNIILCFQLY